MFTLDQINSIHDTLGKQSTLPEYLEALRDLGVDRADSFITDGHSEYYGKNGEHLVSPAVHDKMTVAQETDGEGFLKNLKLHEEGKIDYVAMSKGLADSGIEKWSFDTTAMTITYYGVDGREMLIEEVRP